MQYEYFVYQDDVDAPKTCKLGHLILVLNCLAPKVIYSFVSNLQREKLELIRTRELGRSSKVYTTPRLTLTFS